MRGQKDKRFLQIHNEIGVANCESSGVLIGQCKMAFNDKFSKELIDKYAAIAGTKNMYGEDY